MNAGNIFPCSFRSIIVTKRKMFCLAILEPYCGFLWLSAKVPSSFHQNQSTGIFIISNDTLLQSSLLFHRGGIQKHGDKHNQDHFQELDKVNLVELWDDDLFQGFKGALGKLIFYGKPLLLDSERVSFDQLCQPRLEVGEKLQDFF